MPGLSFICDLEGNLSLQKCALSHSLASLLHNHDYDKAVLIDTANYFLGTTGYKAYPLDFIEDGDISILLEGRIYGDAKESTFRLTTLAHKAFECGSSALTLIEEFILNSDGDYVVCLFHKRRRAAIIFNDLLSRLPLYHFQTGTRFVLTRELRFITELQKQHKIDRMGLAQYLLFGYPLGKRTLMENIYRVPPATVYHLDISGQRIDTQTLHRFNFEEKPYLDKTIDRNATELESLFSIACVNRCSPNRDNILSLSGGLDSRAVAACLHKNNIPFTAKTFLDSRKIAAKDAEIAVKIATHLGSTWSLISLQPPKGHDLLTLLRAKSGLNPLSMAFILPFFEQIREEHCSGIAYFTGDGGDKTLRDLQPVRRIKTMDALLDYIISQNQIFALKEAASLASVDPSELLTEIRNHVAGYPEQNWADKYVHFVIYERAFKWLFEGEDRNRFYFWTVTPFYSVEFFQYAMGCPHEQKADYKLYREFLSKLSPSLASIENANWGTPVIGGKYFVYLAYRSILNKLPTGFKTYIKNRVSSTLPSVYVDCIREQYERCGVMNEHLPWILAEKRLMKNRNRKQIDTLFTFTSFNEELQTRNSTITKYSDQAFS